MLILLNYQTPPSPTPPVLRLLLWWWRRWVRLHCCCCCPAPAHAPAQAPVPPCSPPWPLRACSRLLSNYHSSGHGPSAGPPLLPAHGLGPQPPPWHEPLRLPPAPHSFTALNFKGLKLRACTNVRYGGLWETSPSRVSAFPLTIRGLFKGDRTRLDRRGVKSGL